MRLIRNTSINFFMQPLPTGNSGSTVLNFLVQPLQTGRIALRQRCRGRAGGAERTEDLIVLWLRNDLRVHDNTLLAYTEIARPQSRVVACYCIDPRYFHAPPATAPAASAAAPSGPGSGGGSFDKRWRDIGAETWLARLGVSDGGAAPLPAHSRCGAPRARFLAESLAELQRALLTRFGIPLLVERGRPEEVVPCVIRRFCGDGTSPRPSVRVVPFVWCLCARGGAPDWPPLDCAAWHIMG